MATGDIHNNLRKLRTELKVLKYQESLDLPGLTQGNAKAFMPILHYALTSYSTKLAEEISNKNIVLFAKTDAAFIDCVYKVLRDMFSYRPLVNKDQFFSTQFAERKIIMCTEVLQLIIRKYRVASVSKSASLVHSTSMDSIPRYRSATSGIRPKVTKADKAESSAGSSKMGPPRSTSATKKNTALTRSESARTRSEQSKYRPSSLRSTLSSTDVVVKEINPNLSCDAALMINHTQSIARIKPQAVEVVTMQRSNDINILPRTSDSLVEPVPTGSARSSQVRNETLMAIKAEIKSEMMDEIASVVNGKLMEINIKLAEIKSKTMSAMNIKLNNMMTRLEILESRTDQIEGMQPGSHMTTAAANQHAASSTGPKDGTSWTNSDARLKLLENRMHFLETKLDDPGNSPSTPGSGTFISVESFVQGESKVRKMAREAEAKIRSNSTEDIGSISPINKAIAADSVKVAVLQGQDAASTPERTTLLSSTPTKTQANVSLKFADTPTQDQAHRIEQLMQSTESMLEPLQSEMPVEVSRHEVD